MNTASADRSQQPKEWAICSYALAPGNIQTDGFSDADCQMIFEAAVPLRAHEVRNLRLVLEMQDHGGAAWV